MGFSFLSTYIALWTAVVLQGVLILAVLQRLEKLRQLMERGRSPKETLPIGTSAPQFSATDWSGRPASLQDFARQSGARSVSFPHLLRLQRFCGYHRIRKG